MARGSNLPSVMSHMFSKVPAPQIQRSSFDRSCGRKLTFDPGYIVPIYVDEVLPGDTVKMDATMFARVATLKFPIMDNLFLDTFWFYVPYRILWDNWERFQGSRDNPDDSIDYTIPTLIGTETSRVGGEEFSLWDYMGLPTNVLLGENNAPMALPFRAYNLIWNEWFRDQNTQDSVTVPTGDGPDVYDETGALDNVYELLRRGKRHDYFTSCLPWPQKGDSVSIPLGTSAPVAGDGNTLKLTDGTNLFDPSYVNDLGDGYVRLAQGASQVAVGTTPGTTYPSGDLRIGVTTNAAISGLVADLTLATAATINDLREAFATQQLLEIDARAGTRYKEIIMGHFGVTVQDFRLQRPEYLGGSSKKIEVIGVPQTGESGTTPQGNLAAFTAVQDKNGFTKSFDEHGLIMGLVNVRADITYQQGIARMWTRRTRYDLYMPVYAHLGEQAVLNREIYAQSDTDWNTPLAANEEVFGYQERWAEYRYGASMVMGAFRSNATAPLDAWHLALNFSALPVLDDGTFMPDNPPISRVAAVGGSLAAGQALIMDTFLKTRWARPMPVYSVPGLERL